MKRFALTTAIALGLAAPAMAARQLEKSLGVAPGVYTLSQLVEIKHAAETDGGGTRAYFGGADDVTVSSRSAVTPGAAQLARSLGVEPGAYTLSQLVALKRAAETDGGGGAAVLGAGDGVAMSSRGVATGAAAQLAAGLGVAPGRHGLDELVAKHSAASDEGDGAWRIAN